MFLVDFNAFLEASEKSSSYLKEDRGTLEFREFVNANALVDVGFSGSPFTWCNMKTGSWSM